MRVRSWCLLAAVLVSCTPAVDGPRPAPPPSVPVSAPVQPEAAAPSPAAAPPADAPCSAARGTDIDTSATGRTPEAALAAFTTDGLSRFAPEVRSRRVTFFAKDGTRAVIVERVGQGWAVTGFSEPACTPALIRRGLRSDERDMACTRAVGGLIAGPLSSTSELEAVAEHILFVERRDPGPPGPDGGAYVPLQKRAGDEDARFGHFDERGLQSVVGVDAAGGKFAVDSINWCRPRPSGR